MNKQNNKAEVSVPFNQSQTAYLQRLGLTTLLERKFPKSLKVLVKSFWANRMTIGFAGLLAYSFLSTFVLASFYSENKQQDAKLKLALKNHSDHIAQNHGLNSSFKPDGRFTPKGNYEQILTSLEDGSDINQILGQHGATIMHKAFAQHVDVRSIDYLVQKGGDLNFQRLNEDKATPLMAGVYRGAYDQVLHAVKKYPHLIDLSVKNGAGKTLENIVMVRWLASKKSHRKHIEPLHDHLTLVYNQVDRTNQLDANP